MVASGLVLVWQRKDFFDGIIFIYSAFSIFNGGQILLIATIGLPTGKGFLDDHFPLQQEANLIALVGFSCISMAFGMALANLSPSSHSTNNNNPYLILRYKKSLTLLGFALLSVTIFPYVYEVQIYLQNLFASGRYGMFGDGDRTGLEASGKILFHAFPISGLLLIAGGKKNSFWLLLGLMVCIVNLSFHLYLGNRGYAVMPMLAAIWLIDRLHYKFSRIWLGLTGIATLSIFFPMIRFYRSSSGNNILLNNDLEVSALDLIRYSFYELGNNLRIVGWISGIIQEHGLQWGEIYIRALSTVIPNIFWEVHWGVQGIIVRKEIKMYVREEVLGWDKQMGWGGSMLAEAWLNFGLYGSVLTIGILGYFFSSLHRWSIKGSNPARLFVFSVLLSSVFMAIRGDFHQLVRPFFWHGVLFFLLAVVLTHYKPQINPQKS